MSELILRDWNGKSIRHREDGFMSLTDMCQAGGKLFGGWMRLESTKEYLEVLRNKHYADLHNGPIEVNVGGSPETTGTWGDRRVALRLAQWISPHFALQVDEWIEELLTTGNVNIGPDPIPEPEPKALPGTSLERWAELIASLPGLANSPIVMSALQCRVAEELSGARSAMPVDAPILLTVRANQLGCSHSAIGNGSLLGKYIKACGFEPLGKEQHGRYPVNTYHPSPELDQAILNFCDGVE
jgi:hypothetical protein